MKTRYYFIFAALIATLAGCEKEAALKERESKEQACTVLTVGISDTKTHLGAPSDGVRKVYWNNGDQLALNGTESNALSNIEEGTASATITWDGTFTPPYKVLYPSSAYTDATHITLPAIRSTIVLMLVLRMGSVLDTGYDHLILMANALNRSVSQTLDVFVYENGIKNGQYSYTTAVGLMNDSDLIRILCGEPIGNLRGTVSGTIINDKDLDFVAARQKRPDT